jgi:hypothetical protein
MTDTPIKDQFNGADVPLEDVVPDLMKIKDRVARDIAIKEAAKRIGASVAAVKEEIARRSKKPGDVVPIKRATDSSSSPDLPGRS